MPSTRSGPSSSRPASTPPLPRGSPSPKPVKKSSAKPSRARVAEITVPTVTVAPKKGSSAVFRETPGERRLRLAKEADDETEGFKLVTRRSPRSSPRMSESSDTSAPATMVTAEIADLPPDYQSAKALANVLRTIDPHIKCIKILKNRCFVESSTPDLIEKLQSLPRVIGRPVTVGAPAKRPTVAPGPGIPRASRATYSCVLRGVELDITPEDVAQHLKTAGVTFKSCWRIRSRALNKDTTLFRVVTTSEEAVDQLLQEGLRMFYRHYTAEPSRPAAPQPLQCTKCMAFDHSSNNCRAAPCCSICSGPHSAARCKSGADLKCTNCGGAHSSMAIKCPSRPAVDETTPTATLKCVDEPSSKVEHLADSENLAVLAVSETKLHPSRCPRLRSFRTFHRSFSRRVVCGGVALAVRSNIPALPVTLPPEMERLQLVGACIATDLGPVRFFSVYLPPDEPLPPELLEFIAEFPRAVIMGDFNARHTSFGDSTTNRSGRIMYECLLDLPLFRVPCTDPTFVGYQGSSITDHILVTESLAESFPDRARVADCISSDHVPLVASTNLLEPPRPPTVMKRKIRKYQLADWEGFRQLVDARIHPETPMLTPADVDAAVDVMTDAVSAATEAAIPVVEVKIPIGRPPLPPHILGMIKHKRRLYRDFVRSHNPALKTEWNRLNALVRLEVTRFKEKQWTTTCSSLDHRDGARFWKKFRALSGLTARRDTTLIDDDTPLITDADKAEAFATLLEEVQRPPEDPRFCPQHERKVDYAVNRLRLHTLPTIPHLPPHPLTEDVSYEEVRTALHRAKNSAPGRDNITWKSLGQLSDYAVHHLANTYTACIKLGHFPSAWKSADVVMIPKSGKDPQFPASYRPISLLNTLGKGMERIITNRLRRFAEERSLLPDIQYGFRERRSTTDPLLLLERDASSSISNNNCTLALFLDIERAFDKVWHSGLLYKLHSMGLPPAFLRLTHQYLTSRRAAVRVGETRSAEFTPLAGVPQGSVLAPLLFILFCADVPRPTGTHQAMAQYADDTAYWTTGGSSEAAASRLQSLCTRLDRWMSRWRLRPNPLKSQLVLLAPPLTQRGKRFDPRDATIALWGTRIYSSPSAIYLGVTISPALSWKPEVERILQMVRSRCRMIYAVSCRLKGCRAETLLHTYKTFVRPIIEYRWPVLCASSASHRERIASCERAVLRRILRLRPWHPGADVYQRAAIQPVLERLELRRERHAAAVRPARP